MPSCPSDPSPSNVKLAGSQLARDAPITSTSQLDSTMSFVVKSTCPLSPTTVTSGRLQKRRTKASRNRRVSISKNTRIGSLGTALVIGAQVAWCNEHRRGLMVLTLSHKDGCCVWPSNLKK